jgi:TRAP transporter TAXI family solute receptor
MNHFSFLAILFLALSITSCNTEKKYKIATSSKSGTYYRVGEIIGEVLSKEAGFEVEVLEGKEYTTISNCKLLLEEEVDFALAQNDTKLAYLLEKDQKAHDLNIRTVIPVYPEVCFIVYPDSLNPKNIRELVIGRRIGIGPEESGTSKFMKSLFLHFGISEDEYTPVYTSFGDNNISNEEIDISCAITGFNNRRIVNMLQKEKGKLFSFDDPNLAFHGSAVDGFCLKYPRARTFIIPRNTYGASPDTPILTLAVDCVLLTHSGMDEVEIYEFTEQFFENIQLFANQDALLGTINEKFNQQQMNFPLHRGVKQYLERNKPSIFERYAELGGVMFSICVVLFGLINSYGKRTQQKKKDRIDEFYVVLLKIEKEIPTYQTEQEVIEAKEKVFQCKITAFELLVDEKLKANESFRIFISLLSDTLLLLEKKGKEMSL